MFDHLHIHDTRERVLVGLADRALRAGSALFRRSARPPASPPRRILLLRLERIGDLLMTLDAIAAVRAQAPLAEIDLVTGSWNGGLAALIPGVDRVDTLDAPWLGRQFDTSRPGGPYRHAWRWRRREYDLAINFEGDIRSNVLMALAGAPRRVGFGMAGGSSLLTDCAAYDPGRHVAVNQLRLLDLAFGSPGADGLPALAGWPQDEAARLARLSSGGRRLTFPAEAVERARRLLGSAPRGGPLVGVHAGGGRTIKQWDPRRFAGVAAELASLRQATIVLTGSAGDRPQVDALRAALPDGVSIADSAGALDVVHLGALLAQLDLFITGDTGPMHLAAACGTPTVAVFGPSSPARWGPLGRHTRVVRIDLPCSPCNRIRRPPARCVGHVPDCLSGVGASAVLDAALDLLAETAGRGRADAAGSA